MQVVLSHAASNEYATPKPKLSREQSTRTGPGAKTASAAKIPNAKYYKYYPKILESTR